MNRQASVCFIQVGDEVLLLKRQEKEGRFAGWCLPGGKQEPGETALDTCIRETDEETMIRVYGPDYIGTHVSGSGDFDVSIYYKQLLSKPPVEVRPREHSTFEWVKFDDLGNYELSGNTKKFMDLVFVSR